MRRLAKSTFDASLPNEGYNTIVVKNYWNAPNNPYNGVNTFVKSPSGQIFELQYHTPESFEVKNGKMHKLYEEWRVLPDEEPQKEALQAEMMRLSQTMQMPPGIEGVK